MTITRRHSSNTTPVRSSTNRWAEGLSLFGCTLLFIGGFILFPANSVGASATLSWCANPESNIAGYTVYIGNSTPVNVTTTNYIFAYQPSTTYQIGLAAYNTLGLQSSITWTNWTSPSSVVAERRYLTNIVSRADRISGPWTVIREDVWVLPIEEKTRYYKAELHGGQQ